MSICAPTLGLQNGRALRKAVDGLFNSWPYSDGVSQYIYHPDADKAFIFERSRPARIDASRRDADDTLNAILVDWALILGIVIFFGSVLHMTMKIQDLKEAPEWSVLLYSVPLVVSLIFIAQKPLQSLRSVIIAGPFTLLVAWAAISFLWSHMPLASFKQGLLFIATLLVAVTMAQNLSWARIGRVFSGVFIVQATLSTVVAMFFPEWGVMVEEYPGAWAGLWSHKQTFGIAMAMGVAYTVGYLFIRPKAWLWGVPGIIMMLFCVLKSQATNATVAAFASLLVLFFVLGIRRHVAAALIGFWCFVVACIFLSVIFVFFSPELFHLLGKSSTLTGRTDVWAAVERSAATKPWLGWGYQGFWYDRSLASPVEGIEQELDGFRPPDAHSILVELKLQLGLIGLALGGWAFFRAWRQSIAQFAIEPGMYIAISFMTAYTFMCFIDSIGLYAMDNISLALHVILVKTALSSWENARMQNGRSSTAHLWR